MFFAIHHLFGSQGNSVCRFTLSLKNVWHEAVDSQIQDNSCKCFGLVGEVLTTNAVSDSGEWVTGVISHPPKELKKIMPFLAEDIFVLEAFKLYLMLNRNLFHQIFSASTKLYGVSIAFFSTCDGHYTIV